SLTPPATRELPNLSPKGRKKDERRTSDEQANMTFNCHITHLCAQLNAYKSCD
ncbi:unnamed protein product, partial [marine sediment metagenome]